MKAAYRWLVVGLLLWILGDVAALYHTPGGLAHNGYTNLGSFCLLAAFWSFVMHRSDKDARARLERQTPPTVPGDKLLRWYWLRLKEPGVPVLFRFYKGETSATEYRVRWTHVYGVQVRGGWFIGVVRSGEQG